MAVRREAGALRFAIWRWLAPAWLVLPLFWMCLDGRALGARHRLITGGEEIRWARAPAEAARQRTGVLEHARRAKRVSLPPQALRGDGIRRADVLELRLFDETALAARVEQVAVDAAGTSVIRCRVDGCPLGFVVLTAHAGRCMAAIEVPELGLHQQLAYDPASASHYLVDFGARYPDAVAHATPLQPPAAADAPLAADPPPAAPAGAPGPNDPATVDVMVVYTPEARVWADLHGGIGNVIAQALAKSQLAHDNSRTGITQQLVHAAEIAYTETGSSCTDLGRLQHPGDGHMDDVHFWRACYGADLVVLLSRTEDVGGVGFALGCSAGSADYGFSIARIQQVAGTFTMAHEMAHNMGCGHHKQQTAQPGPGLFPYAAGWRWVSPDGQRRCDLMTYPEGRYFADGITHMAMPYFSSPEISYDGAVTGDPDHGDNRRCLMKMKHVVAAYRQAGQPMPNDSFASAATLSGASGSVTGCNLGASKEPGELDHAGNPGGKSVWWLWTAPASGWVAMDTTGSGFDALLAVYTGDAVGALAEIAPRNGGTPGRILFRAVAGATYRIAVVGADGADGKITLSWNYPPQIEVN
nr:zinc-dependent metalloprotease [Akkermansiaceae bacterium]